MSGSSDHAPQRRNAALLGTNQLLDLGIESNLILLCEGDDKGEWKVTFQLVWYANNAAFGNNRMTGD